MSETAERRALGGLDEDLAELVASGAVVVRRGADGVARFVPLHARAEDLALVRSVVCPRCGREFFAQISDGVGGGAGPSRDLPARG